MIAFDPTKLSVEIARLKTISTAMGGSISIIDEARSSDKKEVMLRLPVPLSVARAYVVAHKATRYLKPMIIAIVRYDGHIVAIERHHLGGFGELTETFTDGTTREWQPFCRMQIQRDLPNLMSQNDKWYFDGRYVYAFTNNKTEEQAIKDGDHLSISGAFRKVDVDTIDLQYFGTGAIPFVDVAPTQRTCLAFISHTGAYAISPPIWKDLADVGMTQFKKDQVSATETPQTAELVEDKELMRHNFDRIDAQMSVNLNFVLTAGRAIGTTFGYEYVEPLQLPRLMVELHTVNLPNVPHQIKSTYDSGLKFSHALAWLLGMTRRANTLETHITMRQLMKYLTKRGLFRNSSFDAARVFQSGMTVADVPRKNLDELLKNQDFTKVSLAAIMQHARDSAKQRKAADRLGLDE